MKFKELLKKVKEMLKTKYPDGHFYIDSNYLKKVLKDTYNEDLENISLSPQVVYKIIINSEIPVIDYAKLNNISYSSVVSNKKRYTSLKKDKNRYTLCPYELLHSKRIENDFGGKIEWLIRNNHELRDKVLEIALERNKGIAESIVDVLREY